MASNDFTVSMVLRAINQMTPVINQVNRQLRTLQTQITQLNTVSNKGTWFDRAIVGADNLQKKLKTAQESMDKLVKSGEKNLMAGTIMALPLVGMIKSAAAVQNTQASLQLAGLTQPQVNVLTSQAQQTMRKTMFNTGQALGIDLQLAQVGMNYSKIRNVSQTATYLAELEANRNGADPNTTAKQFAQMSEQLQISMNPQKVKQLADMVNRISTVTSASVATLSDSSRYFNLVGKIQGLSASDIMLTQGLAARYGLEGSIGGTNLKDFFERLNPQLHMNTMMGKPIVNAFASMGWLKNIKYDSKGTTITGASDVFHDKNGNLVSAQRIFGIIAQTYQKMGNKEQFNALMTRIFGQQGQAIAAAVGQNPHAFAMLQQQMSKVPTVNQGIAAYQKTFNQQFHSFTSTLADFGRQMGTLVLPQLTAYIKRLNDALPKVQKFIDTHKGMLKTILQLYAAYAGFKIGTGILKIAVGGPAKEILGLGRGILAVGRFGLQAGRGLQSFYATFRYFRQGAGIMRSLWGAFAFGRPIITALGSGVFRMASFVLRVSMISRIWAGVQWLVNAAMTANPIGLIIVGIAALIVGIVLLITHWKQVITWVMSVWNWYQRLGDKVKWLIAIFVPFIGIPLLIISKWKVLSGFFDGIWKHIAPVIQGAEKFFGIGGGSPPALAGSGGGKSNVQVTNNFTISSTDPKNTAREVSKTQDKYYQSRYPKPAVGH